MALSAQDRRIIALIERGLMLDDPRWSRRYARRHRRLDRLELKQPGQREREKESRRRSSVLAVFAAWIALVCADASGGPGIWLWIALVATAVTITLAVMRTRTHRHGRRGGCAL